jgi:hypothetical protein
MCAGVSRDTYLDLGRLEGGDGAGEGGGNAGHFGVRMCWWKGWVCRNEVTTDRPLIKTRKKRPQLANNALWFVRFDFSISWLDESAI